MGLYIIDRDMGAQNTGRSIKSVELTAEIVDQIREMEGATVTELADRIGVTPGSVHTHLSTLKEIGYVVQNDTEYDLGPELMTLGEYVRNNTPLYRASKEEVEQLAKETGEGVHLVVEHRGELFALYERFGPDAVGVEFHEHKREDSFDLHCTAAGKAILAYMDESRRGEIITTAQLPEQTRHTITDREELVADLETVRERGYASVDEEQVLGVRAVSAPITGRSGIAGSLAISGPTSRLKGERFHEELPERVRHATNVCEVNLQTVDVG